MQKVLIVDDDVSFGMMVQGYLKKHDMEATLSGSLSKSETLIDKNHFDMVLIDYRLPDGEGLELLRYVKQKYPSVPVVMITAYSDIRVAVKAIKEGAYEYITKPVNAQELLHVIKEAAGRGRNPDPEGNDYVVGTGTETRQVEEHIKLVAPTELSVLIQGESGTGKEYVARRIHELSTHSEEPFVAVDCGALTPEIASSELFGHVKGSFTGAIDEKKGHFESVGKGTIFLDEVGNLSYEVQMKLLRAIQERRAHRLGGNKEFQIEARILSASNDDLRENALKGSFREDLYHRLNEFTITIPPLRDRKDELMRFAGHFLSLAANEFNKDIRTFSEEVHDIFCRYQWPGNLRELRNVIRRAVLLSNGGVIESSVIPPELIENASAEKPSTDLSREKNESEKQLILKTLEKARYNKSKAAQMLGIDRKTLYNKLQRYEIDY
ncbi:MAG: sigma-54-dependent transcriptional regulator [Marinilabiliaceae bacterium]